MADMEACILVRELIPRYLDGDCSRVENILIEDHCSHCPECRMLLQKARTDRQSMDTEDVKEILFLSRLRSSELSRMDLQLKLIRVLQGELTHLSDGCAGR